MARTDFSEMECSVARTLETIGDRWSLLILRDAFYGLRRFDDFRLDLGVARNILADRLGKLVAQGVLERRAYQERPPRYEYRLTEKGADLLPVILAMMAWGDKWTAPAGDPPVKLTHTTCGRDTTPQVRWSHCGEDLRLRELRAHPLNVRLPERAGGALAGV